MLRKFTVEPTKNFLDIFNLTSKLNFDSSLNSAYYLNLQDAIQEKTDLTIAMINNLTSILLQEIKSESVSLMTENSLLNIDKETST